MVRSSVCICGKKCRAGVKRGTYLGNYREELERLSGGIIQPGSHLGMRTLVICHSINTVTDFQQKKKIHREFLLVPPLNFVGWYTYDAILSLNYVWCR